MKSDRQKPVATISIALACLVLLLALNLIPSSARAQLGPSPEELERDMQNLAPLVKAYFRDNKTLPTDPASCDKLLYRLYKRSRQYDPNQPLPYPTSDGTYRVLGRFRVAFDLSIDQESNTLIAWRKTPPDSWKGASGTLGILSNGKTRFLLYAIGDNGRPIVSDNGLTIFDVYDCESGTEDERVF